MNPKPELFRYINAKEYVPYFAIAYEGSDQVSLLCTIGHRFRNSKDNVTDRYVRFHVINGAWDGTFYFNPGHIRFQENEPHDIIKAEIVWAGNLPNHLHDHGSAMKWIDSQL